jgi:hypothetical protein
MAMDAATLTETLISFKRIGPPRCLLTDGLATPSEELGTGNGPKMTKGEKYE